VLFFAVIVVLVAREQMLADRHGVAVKGTGPLGGHRADYAWAGLGLVVVALVGWGLSTTHTAQPSVAMPVTTDQSITPGHNTGGTSAKIDDALTALRASNPSQSHCAASLATLIATLNKFDGV
jgi:hypothetical protein